MSNILITELKNQGPGDILGAIGGETDIDPGIIGNIDINGSRALIEVNNGKAEELATQLNGKKVDHSRVSVRNIEEEDFKDIETIYGYVDRFKQLVELERKEEMREHEESIRTLSGQQREAEGKAILHLRGRDEGNALEGKLVKFMRQHKGEPLPETEIAVGDLVMISRRDPLLSDNPTGTVVQKTNYSITVAFDQPRSFIFDKGLRMDLYVNDITYQRMKDALTRVEEATGRLADLRNIIVGLRSPEEPEKAEVDKWFNKELNESQKEAVAHSLGAEDVHLIHGPPGTGKTTTVIEVIEQAVANGQKVLATAASNIAVDNMLDFLLDRGVKAVRVGHPARVTPQLQNHTLDSLIEENDQYRKSEELRAQAFEKKEEQEKFPHPSGKYRRGMSNTKIKELAEEGRGSRGVSEDKIQEMARWIELQNKIEELFEEADQLREEAVNEILETKQVICTTNSTAGSELMENREFDLVVIDEATQSTEPSCLIPITRAKKVVMAGDHRQLPPTVKNRKAADKGLEDTLFERLAEKHSDIKNMLDVQYRMHENIMAFSNKQFYDGILSANESVKEYTLEDFQLDINLFDNNLTEILDPREPVIFVDTAGRDAAERTKQGSTSKENPEEALLVAKMADNLLRSGVQPEDIAVISPYKDQVDLLDRKIDTENLETKSVDGFQGREKEVVIISLTRSNKNGNIGFLEDVRRLNVSLTRAKRKLIMVGDSSTVSSHEVYADFIDYVREKGRVIEL
ncbi:IGHMBP2 family helicase [Aliifodinibius salipaludis]|uniref:DNA helicase n=1 Tax=Fodinibius salipaludis TaxID=2032627 RepID=A0A2A2GGI7_9BACT|nr:IGHMBP2 family helicase [Aliifodinibius salipaludis]PAU95892.1 IGHMBP2 family helicase [Aliifodinibius salipaludis]